MNIWQIRRAKYYLSNIYKNKSCDKDDTSNYRKKEELFNKYCEAQLTSEKNKVRSLHLTLPQKQI